MLNGAGPWPWLCLLEIHVVDGDWAAEYARLSASDMLLDVWQKKEQKEGFEF